MPSKIKIFLIVILILNLLAINVALVYFWQQLKIKNKDSAIVSVPVLIPTSIPVPTIIPSPTATPTPQKILVKKPVRTISYIPISGNGSTLENKWVDLQGTEFYIYPLDYPNLKEAYFEANVRLFNGNGKAFLRLFDITTGIEVWGSNIETSNQNFTSLSSGKLTLRPGNHLYRVQAKSLTADTTVFNSGRIKLILEN